MSYATIPEPGLLNVDEYLEREAASKVKHEYVAGQMYAFTGATRSHNRIVGCLLLWLANAAEGDPCGVCGSDKPLRAAADVFYYPDITVVCDPADIHSRYVEQPGLLIEVLSPTTMETDLREKLVVYRNIESMQGYLIVAPDEGWIELHERGEDGAWRLSRGTESEPLALPCLDAAVSAGDLFRDL